MKHKQITDKIGFQQLNESVEDDLIRLVTRGMALKNGGSLDDIESYVLPLMLTRWNCVLKAETGLVRYYKEKVYLTLATQLHKYGFSDKHITEKALEAIDLLNDNVVLSDDFFRKSPKIKEFLKTKPTALKRKPSRQKNITFFRENDVISINIDGTYYIAFIHKLIGVNESPVIEFYEQVFNRPPKLEDIKIKKARGQQYNDDIIRASKFAIYGMKYQPDLANQIHLLSASENSTMAPDSSHLEECVGVYTVSNLFTIQDTVRKMFSESSI
ncbi:hypothetical protein [Maribacter sp.]|uniref:hypothetical protein n=1 Tax=Maribacter sp. TaxID=1897614 RepID=UPI003299216B